MFQAKVDGVLLEGRPLDWTKTNMQLLARDGQLHDFDPRKAAQARKTAPRFVPYTDAEMRSRLYKEFEGRFAFTSTTHYLVVHPAGQKAVWANRFEKIYRAFENYFRVRNFKLRAPGYPLVAIIFPNQSEYMRYVRASGQPAHPGTLGHYDPETNRVYLFDSTAGRSGEDWSQNADTIIHEATHQAAFNLGVHNRFAAGPRWAIEGLATMFEPRAVWAGRSYENRQDRINQGRMHDYTMLTNEFMTLPLPLRNFVATDQYFRMAPAAAYAQAWALSFYLSETRPQEYSRYLARTAQRPYFSKYGSQERWSDFTDVFGDNTKVLEANFASWIKKVSKGG